MKSCSSSEEKVISSVWGGEERPQGEKEGQHEACGTGHAQEGGTPVKVQHEKSRGQA